MYIYICIDSTQDTPTRAADMQKQKQHTKNQGAVHKAESRPGEVPEAGGAAGGDAHR